MGTFEKIAPYIGMASGICGMVLGIMNYRRLKRKEKDDKRSAPVKLKVIPLLAFPGPLDELIPETHYSERAAWAMGRIKTFLCIKVVNESIKPVILFEVGWIDEDGHRIKWRNPRWEHVGDGFPLSLAPGESTIAFEFVPRPCEFTYEIAYALTENNDCFKGQSPIISDLVRGEHTKYSSQDIEFAMDG